MFSVIRRKYTERRRSLFVRMLISNGLLLLLPVIIWFVYYTNIEQIMKTNAERTNLGMLEQLRLTMDSEFREIEQLSHQIILNPKLRYLLDTKDQDLSKRYQLVQFIRDYLQIYSNITSNFVYDFYIYLDRSDAVIKPKLVTDSLNFYNNYYRFEHLSYKEWRKQLKSYHSQAYLPASTLQRNSNLNESPIRVITFMQSLPVEDPSDIKGNLTVLINESKIHEMTQQFQLANGSSVYIVNKNHELISMTPNASLLPSNLIDELNTKSGLINRQLNEQDVMISFTSSEETGWHYIAVMPLDLYLQKLKQMEKQALWLLLLFILVGSAAAYGITYRNYFPIKRTVEAVSAGMARPYKPAKNELDYIMEMMKVSWNEERQIKNKLRLQLPLLRSNYLHRVLLGCYETPEQMRQSLEFMGIRFPFAHFVVILVQVESLIRFSPDQSEKQWALVRFIISNLAEDAASESLTIHSIDLEKGRLALVANLMSDRLDQPPSRIKDIISELHQILENRFRLEINFAISGVHEGQHQIGEAYLEASAALEYRMVNGLLSIFYFTDIRQEKLQYHYPIETELQLINCIRSGDKDRVVILLTELFDNNFRDESITPELGRCLLFSLAGTLLRILNSDATSAYRIFTEEENHPISLLLSCKTTDEMFEKAKELYILAAESFKQSDHNVQLLEQIQTYIEKNFADPNMSLNMLSDHLHVTPQYISKFFKKVSGRNLNEYLTTVRLNHAKKLMKDQQLTNAQIAKMVGYASDSVFIRVFKKVEGITPGKYRESFLEDSQIET